ncbi:MAG: SDR family oxidoreductase [Pseudomonadota bacterium]
MIQLLCFGFGYSARALAERLLARDLLWQIRGTTSRPLQAPLNRFAENIAICPLESLTAEQIAAAEFLLLSIPPKGGQDPILPLLDEVRRAGPVGWKWVGYLSATSVYGDHQGRIVTEETPCQPSSRRGQARLDAERAWGDFFAPMEISLGIFRLAGIYGPGRSVLDSLRAGTARYIKDSDQVFNRIHVTDIAQALQHSMTQRPKGCHVYNLADDLPALPADVLRFGCELLGYDMPEGISLAQAGEKTRSFYGESKRTANDKIKRALGLTLAYPDYRAGLTALASQLTRSG